MPAPSTRWGGPQSEVGRQLAFTAKVMREWFESRLADAGGSLATWIVLSAVVEAGEPLGQSHLAARMSIGGPTLVRHLDRLQAEGLVARRRDHHDRRVTRVEITAAGRRLHAELEAASRQANRELTDLMSSEEEAVLRSVLERLADHVLGPADRDPDGDPAASSTRPDETEVA